MSLDKPIPPRRLLAPLLG